MVFSDDNGLRGGHLMRYWLLALLVGCSPLDTGPDPAEIARARVAVAVAMLEIVTPPQLPNDFEQKIAPPAKTEPLPTPGRGSPTGADASPVAPTTGQDPASPLDRTKYETLCVNVNGVDYDLDVMLSEWKRNWTWPGNTETSLRQHLRQPPHIVGGIDDLPYDTIKRIHAVLHERELRATPAKSPAILPRSNCPGGVCPTPQYQQQPTRWRFGGRRR